MAGYLTLLCGLWMVPAQIPEALAPQGRTATIGEIELYFEVYGDGSPLLLLHGFTASSQVWKSWVGEFAKTHRVIVPDLRGHGRSTNPSKQFTHRLAASDVFELMDQQRVPRFKAIGLSSGGMILLHMATQKPERIQAMILVSTGHYFPEEARSVMEKSTVESMTPQEWELARQIHKKGDEQIRMLRRQFREFKDNLDDVNFTPPLLGKIKARTLIVHGDRDPFFPLAIPVEMHQALPQSFLWIIPNGGHTPIYDPSGDFLRTAVDFLNAPSKTP